jgi:hypothetical protein
MQIARNRIMDTYFVILFNPVQEDLYSTRHRKKGASLSNSGLDRYVITSYRILFSIPFRYSYVGGKLKICASTGFLLRKV